MIDIDDDIILKYANDVTSDTTAVDKARTKHDAFINEAILELDSFNFDIDNTYPIDHKNDNDIFNTNKYVSNFIFQTESIIDTAS